MTESSLVGKLGFCPLGEPNLANLAAGLSNLVFKGLVMTIDASGSNVALEGVDGDGFEEPNI